MSDDWQLYYWGMPFAGRAEFVRLVFEEAGVKYREVSDNEEIVRKIIQGDTDNYPAFAPPLLKNGSFEISQTSVICRYLGEKFGLVPDSAEDKAHAEQINISCHDYYGEGFQCFHGVIPTGQYASQKEETQPYIDRFVKERFPRWMGHFQKLLEQVGGGKEYLFGNKVTYADLALFQVLRATESSFPDTWKNADYPLLKAFQERMTKRPNLEAFFKSDRSKAFMGDSMM